MFMLKIKGYKSTFRTRNRKTSDYCMIKSSTWARLDWSFLTNKSLLKSHLFDFRQCSLIIDLLFSFQRFSRKDFFWSAYRIIHTCICCVSGVQESQYPRQIICLTYSFTLYFYNIHSSSFLGCFFPLICLNEVYSISNIVFFVFPGT